MFSDLPLVQVIIFNKMGMTLTGLLRYLAGIELVVSMYFFKAIHF